MQHGKSKSQSAVEFVSTYAFVFLVVAVIIVLLYLFSSIPTKTLPFQCTAFSGFSCTDVVYTTMGANSQLTVSLTDAQPGVVNISAFNARINGVSVIGTCTPRTLLPGNPVTCTALFPISAGNGNIYSGVFNISANYCANGASNISNVTCKTGSSFLYAGSLTTQAQPSTVTTMPYIYCVGDGSIAPYNVVYYAPVSTTGIGTWQSTTNYPIGFDNAGCVINGSYIYCNGGAYTYPYNQVYYAPVSTAGIGTWTQTTSYPVAMYYAGCSAYNNYIYCVGTGGTRRTLTV